MTTDHQLSILFPRYGARNFGNKEPVNLTKEINKQRWLLLAASCTAILALLCFLFGLLSILNVFTSNGT